MSHIIIQQTMEEGKEGKRAGKIVEGNTYGRIIPFITNSKTIKLLNNHHISYKEQGGHMYLGTRKKRTKE